MSRGDYEHYEDYHQEEPYQDQWVTLAYEDGQAQAQAGLSS